VPDAPIPTAPKACTTWSCPIYIPNPLLPTMCKLTCDVTFVVNTNKKIDKTPFTKLDKKVLEKLGNDKGNWLSNTLFKACN
jgi:hypothetical protein